MLNLNYMKIINCICSYYGISDDKILEFINKREERYLMLLILKDNNCLDENCIKNGLRIESSRRLKSNLKVAQKKFLIDKYFREKYYALENCIKKELNQKKD